MDPRPVAGPRRRPPRHSGEEAGRRADDLSPDREFAPAKVNLCLHVAPPTGDGYHPLASLVAFADVGDILTARPGDRLSLEVTGPFADDLTGGTDEDNLVLRAVRALAEAAGIAPPPLALTLDKRLPVASGLGGGSSDAGAALRLVRRMLDLPRGEAALETVAARIGADGPMCLRARSAWAEGYGERLETAPWLPPLPAVLVNPRLASPTAAVYRAYDAGPAGSADRAPPPDRQDVAGVAAWLAEQRNDLQSPAVALTPGIGPALEAMAAAPGVRLSRMSGSGATVFGLFDTRADADRAAERLAAEHGAWWVMSTLLGDHRAMVAE